MLYQIAINTISLQEKIPAGSRLWYKFNNSFVPQEIPSHELLSAIYLGHSFCAVHKGTRKLANFVCGQHIAVDLDTEDERSSLPKLMTHEFVQVYASILYTTPSHTLEKPRARIVFLLDQPIGTAEGYKTAIDYLYSLFPGADPSCVDASRFLYGSYHCTVEYPDNILPLAHLRSLYKQAMQVKQDTRLSSPRPHPHGTGKYDPNQLVQWAIEDAPAKGRNNQGYILARRLRESGLSQAETTNYMESYRQRVERDKLPKYSEQEVAATVRSAYGGRRS